MSSVTYQYWPVNDPIPEGWEDTGSDLGRHAKYSRLIKMIDNDETPSDILTNAATLVSGDRALTYGDFIENHDNIAAAWNFWNGIRKPGPFTAFDALMMMALMKIARIAIGKGTLDNFIDACGYLAMAAVAWLRMKP